MLLYNEVDIFRVMMALNYVLILPGVGSVHVPTGKLFDVQCYQIKSIIKKRSGDRISSQSFSAEKV